MNESTPTGYITPSVGASSKRETGGTCTLCGREVAVDVTIEWSKALGLRHLAGSPLCGVTVQEGAVERGDDDEDGETEAEEQDGGSRSPRKPEPKLDSGGWGQPYTEETPGFRRGPLAVYSIVRASW
jgi:hypothetical protein